MGWRKERKNQGKDKDKQNGIEKRKEEYKERTTIKEWDGEKKGRIKERTKIKEWDGEKKGRIRGKDKDKKNEMETRKKEYEERTRIKE